MSIVGYINHSEQVRTMSERARRVSFHGETPSERYHGFVEVMSGKDGTMEVHMERSALKKYKTRGIAKWHTQSSYATISVDDWKHLCSAV